MFHRIQVRRMCRPIAAFIPTFSKKRVLFTAMPFKLPQFTVCCCGCSLRTGVYIIGVINILFFLVIGVTSVAFEIKWMTRGAGSISATEFLENDLFDLTIFARIVLAICLIYGCYKDNPSYMLAFFMMQVSFVILYILFALLHILLHVVGFPSEELFIYTIGAVTQSYYAIIIYSHYRNLKAGRSISI